LKFSKIFCVKAGSSIVRFAYFSSFGSSLTRINNKEGHDDISIDFLNCRIGKGYSKFLKIKLCRGGIHPNPGPARSNLSFTTFNCRGLKEIGKFRRLMSKINQLLDQGRVVALQETHRLDDRLIQNYCKHKYVRNCEEENKAGVILFFNNNFELNRKITDEQSRYIIAVIENTTIKLIVGNVYFPNDHRCAYSFGEEYYRQIRNTQADYPEHYVVTMGDYNACFGLEDSIQRVNTKVEADLTKMLRNQNEVCELGDTYRLSHRQGGFTWKRGSCFSRLDYIFMSNYLMGRILKVETNWSFEKSDHAAVSCFLNIDEKVKKGPGIARLNGRLLDNKELKESIRKKIVELAGQIIPSWNPHIKLEYMKMSIRSAFAEVASEINRTKKNEISELEIQINSLNRLREECVMAPKIDAIRLNRIEETINEMDNMINEVRNKYSEDIAFKAGAKWYEEGEKSSKYFLGLLKKRTEQKLIDGLIEGETEINSKEGIMECITKFYRKLYDSGEVVDEQVDGSFFDNCPKLDVKNRDLLEREITLEELKESLKGCKETSPGPDGITYKIYKEYWEILGMYILESWNYSVKMGTLPPSHKESTLILLPKAGKNLREIKNWRPITLTNCDAKIITKALAIRMSKILETIVDPSQTAYIPGRSVMDNIRSNLYTKNYCSNHQIDALLVSLDAKKAFDSVSHEYIREVLKNYGFGETFINYFNTIYKDLEVRILVNGFFSDKIDIKRGVKQGDALSCSLFILCVDPLIRNIKRNVEIRGVEIRSRNNKKGLQ